MADKTVFVTVGTTQFDDLMKAVTEEKVLKLFIEKGYNRLLLQIGNGNFKPEKNCTAGLNIEEYRLKDSIQDDIILADLIISHAGAGSCIEVLELGKPLIVVVNKSLMNNHQAELANILESRNYAAACTTESLYHTLCNLNINKFQPYPKSDLKIFNEHLDKLVGIMPK